MTQDLIYKLYSEKRTVFSLQEIAMMIDEPDFNKLKQRINYLSRTINIGRNEFVFRKIKNELLYNTTGIVMSGNGISQASPARAFLDTLYLSKEYYFDALEGLDKEEVNKILPVYQSGRLTKQVQKLLKDA